MSLPSGTRPGPNEVPAAIGAGGRPPLRANLPERDEGPRLRVAAGERRVSGLPLRKAPRRETCGGAQPGFAPGRSLRRGMNARCRLGIAGFCFRRGHVRRRRDATLAGPRRSSAEGGTARRRAEAQRRLR